MEFSGDQNENDSDDEEVDQLLESLSGIEKCFLPKSPDDKEEIGTPVAAVENINMNENSEHLTEPKENETSNSSNTNINSQVDDTFTTTMIDTSLSFFAEKNADHIKNILGSPDEREASIDEIITSLSDNDSIIEEGNEHEKPFMRSKLDQLNSDVIPVCSRKNCVLELSQEKDSDCDVVLEKICKIPKRNHMESNSEEYQDLPDGVTYICTKKSEIQNAPLPLNQVPESDSDCDIIEHIESAPHIQNGFIDLTGNLSDEETIQNDDTKNTFPKDETETLLKEISKIRRALSKRKKKKRKKKKSDEKKRSRSRSESQSKTISDFKKMSEFDEDESDKRLNSFILPSRNLERDRFRRGRSHSNENTAHSRPFSEIYRRISRSRERDYRYHDRRRSRGRRKSKKTIHGGHEKKKRGSLSCSSSESIKRRRECSPLEHIREQLRKENESAVTSLMCVNKVHQRSSTVEDHTLASNPRLLNSPIATTDDRNADCIASANVLQSSTVDSRVIASNPQAINQISDMDLNSVGSGYFLPSTHAPVDFSQYYHPAYHAMYHQNYASYASYYYGGTAPTMAAGHFSHINVEVRQLYSYPMSQNPPM